MSRPTLVFVRHLQIADQQHPHGSELAPGTLSEEIVDQLLDRGILSEVPERRSLYKLFAVFSGSPETEPAFTQEELTAYALLQ